jgi:hypothetical protein
MLNKTFLLASTLATAVVALAPLEAAGIVDKADRQKTRLAATSGIGVAESLTLRFDTREDLLETLRGPVPVDEAAVEKVADKLTPLIGQNVYPSQLAHLIFELCFTDPLFHTLSPLQIKNDVGYILNNLGSGNSKLTEHLFAFYYGYTFEHYAPKKEL